MKIWTANYFLYGIPKPTTVFQTIFYQNSIAIFYQIQSFYPNDMISAFLVFHILYNLLLLDNKPFCWYLQCPTVNYTYTYTYMRDQKRHNFKNVCVYVCECIYVYLCTVQHTRNHFCLQNSRQISLVTFSKEYYKEYSLFRIYRYYILLT